jgi:hypothetical protein
VLPSGAKALIAPDDLIAALKALRHPNSPCSNLSASNYLVVGTRSQRMLAGTMLRRASVVVFQPQMGNQFLSP